MKINLGTVEMSDEDRTRLANVLDEKVSKRKATRVEAKEFIMTHGNAWPIALTDEWDEAFGDGALQREEEQGVDEDEDLIGDGDSLEDLL